jgi:hypothetical protein
LLGLQQDVADFVLHVPRRDEETAIEEAVCRVDDVLDLMVKGQFERAMMRLHSSGPKKARSTDSTLTPGPSPAGAGEGG